jgi:hypothetical protein
MRTGVPSNQDCNHWRSTASDDGRGGGTAGVAGVAGTAAGGAGGTLGAVLQPCKASSNHAAGMRCRDPPFTGRC